LNQEDQEETPVSSILPCKYTKIRKSCVTVVNNLKTIAVILSQIQYSSFFTLTQADEKILALKLFN